MSQAPSASRDAVRPMVPKMVELTEQVLFGDVWERPGLSKRDRSLIVIATLIATYRPEQLKGHDRRQGGDGRDAGKRPPLSQRPGTVPPPIRPHDAIVRPRVAGGCRISNDKEYRP